MPGTTSIIDHASAGNGTFTNNGAPASGARPGITFINATASNGTFINNGGLANGAHGKHRWSVKNDPSTPPADASAIQAVTPSDIFSWPGPDVRLTQQSERTGIENKWFALTGRVVALKIETDGDIHNALQDATGDKQGIVVCEVPERPQWCEIRNMVFSWTRTRFPFHTSSAKKLNVADPPIITVVGKAFFDIGHAPKDQSNRRKYLLGYAAWEIHPVMKIEFE